MWKLFGGPLKILEDHQIYCAGGPVIHCHKKLISTPEYSYVIHVK